jgi:hypothetical protein
MRTNCLHDPTTLILLVILTAVECSAGAGAEPAELPLPSDSVSVRVDAIVSQSSPHGFRFEDAASLPEAARSKLGQMLEDTALKRDWTKVLSAIGIMGGAASHRVIHAFIWQRFRGEIDEETFGAMLTAVDALGWDKSGPAPEALRELMAGTDPEYWRALPWTHTIEGSTDHARILLSQLAINGLSYSGSEVADSALTALARHPLHPRQVGNIKEGIERNRAIRQKGLRSFWIEREPR